MNKLLVNFTGISDEVKEIKRIEAERSLQTALLVAGEEKQPTV